MGKNSIEELADCYVNNPTLVNQLTALGFKPKSDKGMTFREATECSQISNAVRGDLKAYVSVMNAMGIAGQKSPLEEYMDGGDGTPIETVVEATVDEEINTRTRSRTKKRTGDSKEPEQGNGKGERTQRRNSNSKSQKGKS